MNEHIENVVATMKHENFKVSPKSIEYMQMYADKEMTSDEIIKELEKMYKQINNGGF